jgi:TatD DNase family protein
VNDAMTAMSLVGDAPTVRFLDNHCHLEHAKLPGTVDEVVERARAAGVIGFVTVGCDAADSARCIEIAERYPDVWATVGLHPHEAVNGADTLVPLLNNRSHKVLAIGECGLDYHYDHSPRDIQRVAFAAQIALAHQHQLPLVIHTREAWDDTFDVLAAEGMPDRTIFHCFTAGPDEARRCLDLGAYLSFSGVVTFNNSGDNRAAAELCPIDRLMAETDSPYLAPKPHRGRPNEPAYVAHVVAELARIRRESVEFTAEATVRNAVVAFGIPAQ